MRDNHHFRMKLCPLTSVCSPSTQHRAASSGSRRTIICAGWGMAVCPSYSRHELLDAEALSFLTPGSRSTGSQGGNVPVFVTRSHAWTPCPRGQTLFCFAVSPPVSSVCPLFSPFFSVLNHLPPICLSSQLSLFSHPLIGSFSIHYLVFLNVLYWSIIDLWCCGLVWSVLSLWHVKWWYLRYMEFNLK